MTAVWMRGVLSKDKYSELGCVAGEAVGPWLGD